MNAAPGRVAGAPWALRFAVVTVVAALTVAAGCRKHNPLPMPGSTGGTGGGNEGRGGTMPAPTGGNGGNVDMGTPPPVDTAPACGAPDQACCPGGYCLERGCCERGKCTRPFNKCLLADGASCFNGACGGFCGGAPPGATSFKCCKERNCTLPYHVCAGAGEGSCVPCGRAGQPCCADGFCFEKLECGGNGVCGGGADASPPDAPMDTPIDTPVDSPG